MAATEAGLEKIGSVHILLGLVGEGQGIACGVLESLGVELRLVRPWVAVATDYPRRANALVARVVSDAEPAEPYPQHSAGDHALPRLHPATKRPLVLAQDAAWRLGQPAIGCEHLVLGVVHANDERVDLLLRELGFSRP